MEASILIPRLAPGARTYLQHRSTQRLPLHSKLHSIPWQPKCMWYYGDLRSVTVDAWDYRISVAHDTMEWHKGRCEEDVKSISCHLVRWCGPFHLAFLGNVADACTNINSTSGIKRRRRRGMRRWHSTCWHMAQCEGAGWLLWWFEIDGRFRDIRERNVTIRSEVWTANICSLGFWDVRECVALWGVDITEFRVYYYCY